MPIMSYDELERELDLTRTRLEKAVKAVTGTLSAEQLKRAFDIGFQTGMDTALSGASTLAQEKSLTHRTA